MGCMKNCKAVGLLAFYGRSGSILSRITFSKISKEIPYKHQSFADHKDMRALWSFKEWDAFGNMAAIFLIDY
jgi:hypothetical protein